MSAIRTKQTCAIKMRVLAVERFGWPLNFLYATNRANGCECRSHF